jgi:hypothetical protein
LLEVSRVGLELIARNVKLESFRAITDGNSSLDKQGSIIMMMSFSLSKLVLFGFARLDTESCRATSWIDMSGARM